jgi:hypothetical protein
VHFPCITVHHPWLLIIYLGNQKLSYPSFRVVKTEEVGAGSDNLNLSTLFFGAIPNTLWRAGTFDRVQVGAQRAKVSVKQRRLSGAEGRPGYRQIRLEFSG